MKLTEKKIKEFFPSDHRFIHFCAKRFGYSFYNQEAVDSAHYYSGLNLARYLRKHGREFKDERELVSVVMGSIRYGIMTAISDKSRRESRKYKRSVDTVLESDLEIWDDTLSTRYERACVSHDEHTDGTHMLIDSFKSLATAVELLVFDKHIINGITLTELSRDSGYSFGVLNNAKYKIKRKFKVLIEDEQEKLQTAKDIVDHQEEVRPTDEDVCRANRDRRKAEEQDKERSYSQTMSFLHSTEEIWNEDYDFGLDGR